MRRFDDPDPESVPKPRPLVFGVPPRKCHCGKPAEPHVDLCSACLFAEHLDREKSEDFAR